MKHWKLLSIFDVIIDVFRNFVSLTTFHGIESMIIDFQSLDQSFKSRRLSKRYITFAKYSSVVVRIGSFVTGIFLAIALINITWQRSLATPTITTVDTYYHPIWNVSFPAVTICNLNKVYLPAAKDVIRKMAAKGQNETLLWEVFSNLDMLIRTRNSDISVDRKQAFHESMNKYGYKVRNLMSDVMQPCERLIRHCAWLNVKTPCNELFHVSETSEGFCCSFHHRESGWQDNKKHYNLFGAGDYIGMDIDVVPELSEYVSSTRYFYGVHLAFHQSNQFADLDKLIILQPGYDVKIMLTPSVLVTDPNVRSLPISQRKCYFSDEGKSDLNSKYSHSECITDCRVRNIFKICKCIPFYYPHVWLQKYVDAPHCDFRFIKCMQDIQARKSSLLPPKDAIGFDYVANRSDIGFECDECLPDCDHTQYGFQVIIANRRQANDDLKETNTLNLTNIFIGFKESTCIKYRRSIYMTWDNLFASVGGVFGLCLGASIISLIEIAYFVLIRVGGHFIAIFSSSLKRHQATVKSVKPMTVNRINRKYKTNIYKQRIINGYYD